MAAAHTCLSRARDAVARRDGDPAAHPTPRAQDGFGSLCSLQVGLELLQLRTHPGQSRIPPKSEVGQHTSAPYPINTNRVVAARATNLTQHKEDQADPV